MIGWRQSGDSLSAPPGRTNIVMIAVGFGFSLALEADGMIRRIGGVDIPEGLKNVVSITGLFSRTSSHRRWPANSASDHDPSQNDPRHLGAAQIVEFHCAAVPLDFLTAEAHRDTTEKGNFG